MINILLFIGIFFSFSFSLVEQTSYGKGRIVIRDKTGAVVRKQDFIGTVTTTKGKIHSTGKLLATPTNKAEFVENELILESEMTGQLKLIRPDKLPGIPVTLIRKNGVYMGFNAETKNETSKTTITHTISKDSLLTIIRVYDLKDKLQTIIGEKLILIPEAEYKKLSNEDKDQ